MPPAVAPAPAVWREALVVAAAFGVCVLGGALRVDDTAGPPPAAAYAVAVLACAALPLRHRVPLAVLGVTTVAGALAAPLGLLASPLLAAPAAVAAYAVAVRLDGPRAVGALLPAAALLAVVPPLAGEPDSWADVSRLVTVAATPLVAGVLGHATRTRRAYLAAVEDRARRAESDREVEARRRVSEERVRIARELHDVVAHQVTLAHAQAMVAVAVLDRDREQARTNVEAVVASTSHALDDLRATVGLLRHDADLVDAAGATDVAPGLAGLPDLLESFGRAGLAVTLEVRGAAGDLPPGADLTAYRVVQEALTNVTKHAGVGEATVVVAWSARRVEVTVCDEGHGQAAAGRPPGYGIVGMRERATALGGSLAAGPRHPHGYAVMLRLPVPPQSQAVVP